MRHALRNSFTFGSARLLVHIVTNTRIKLIMCALEQVLSKGTTGPVLRKSDAANALNASSDFDQSERQSCQLLSTAACTVLRCLRVDIRWRSNNRHSCGRGSVPVPSVQQDHFWVFAGRSRLLFAACYLCQAHLRVSPVCRTCPACLVA